MQRGRQRYKLDLVILAHTTRREFEEFGRDIKNNSPLLERLRTIYIPYIRSLRDEKRIYSADLSSLADSLNLHLAPGALEVGAKIAIRTRLKGFPVRIDGKDVTPNAADKLLLYDGQNSPTITQNYRRIVETASDKAGEGLDGISPPKMSRELAKLMTATVQCFNPLDFLSALIRWIEETPVTEMPFQSSWMNEAKTVQREFQDELLTIVEKAFEGKYQTMIRDLFNQYTESASRSLDPQRPIDVDPVTGLDRLAPDNKLLDELEGLMGLSAAASREFRQKFLTDQVWMKKKGDTDVDDFPKLAEAIRRRVIGSGEKPREILRLVTPTPDQQVLIDQARERLEQTGFCPDCSGKAIRFASSELRKR